MNKQRKAQIAWWAKMIYGQAQEYADVADPTRIRANSVAHKLDAIAALARRLHFELTGELPR